MLGQEAHRRSPDPVLAGSERAESCAESHLEQGRCRIRRWQATQTDRRTATKETHDIFAPPCTDHNCHRSLARDMHQASVGKMVQSGYEVSLGAEGLSGVQDHVLGIENRTIRRPQFEQRSGYRQLAPICCGYRGHMGIVGDEHGRAHKQPCVLNYVRRTCSVEFESPRQLEHRVASHLGTGLVVENLVPNAAPPKFMEPERFANEEAGVLQCVLQRCPGCGIYTEIGGGQIHAKWVGKGRQLCCCDLGERIQVAPCTAGSVSYDTSRVNVLKFPERTSSLEHRDRIGNMERVAVRDTVDLAYERGGESGILKPVRDACLVQASEGLQSHLNRSELLCLVPPGDIPRCE